MATSSSVYEPVPLINKQIEDQKTYEDMNSGTSFISTLPPLPPPIIAPPDQAYRSTTDNGPAALLYTTPIQMGPIKAPTAIINDEYDHKYIQGSGVVSSDYDQSITYEQMLPGINQQQNNRDYMTPSPAADPIYL